MIKIASNLLVAFTLAVIVLSCAPEAKQDAPQQEKPTTKLVEAKKTYTPEQIAAESKKANEFFQKYFVAFLGRNPMFAAYLGQKLNYGSWNDFSDENGIKENQISVQSLRDFEKEFDINSLDKQTRLSYNLFKDTVAIGTEGLRFQKHSYPINQMLGLHTQIPTFLMNIHRIDDEKDALAFIQRIRGIPKAVDQVIKLLKDRAEIGVIAPKFVFPLVLDASKKILVGKPFDKSESANPLFQVFQAKLAKVKSIADDRKAELTEQAKKALVDAMLPAYKKLIGELESLEKKADTKDGVWKLPNGDDFYEYQLRLITSTELSADEIHNTGLKEMKRIHEEMKDIMGKVNFKGSLKDFFDFMRNDKQFYLSDTEEGKDEYLKLAVDYIDKMKKQLPKMFNILPKADIKVKAVEKFREKSSAKAFYEGPAPDGSRPGKFYVNLANMKDVPTYQLEALAYHEGVPGHHMQIAIAQELKDIPNFRKLGFIQSTAHSEGWGLYSELVPKEMGFYKDPYSDFGRLSMELWRAARLVVDTGIHSKKWTREKAINYLLENTPNSKGECAQAINRYIVIPGQATAYKIGMIKILELRERAKSKLGNKFDIREFHDILLANGPLTLKVLEDLVNEWVESRL